MVFGIPWHFPREHYPSINLLTRWLMLLLCMCIVRKHRFFTWKEKSTAHQWTKTDNWQDYFILLLVLIFCAKEQHLFSTLLLFCTPHCPEWWEIPRQPYALPFLKERECWRLVIPSIVNCFSINIEVEGVVSKQMYRLRVRVATWRVLKQGMHVNAHNCDKHTASGSPANENGPITGEELYFPKEV